MLEATSVNKKKENMPIATNLNYRKAKLSGGPRVLDSFGRLTADRPYNLHNLHYA